MLTAHHVIAIAVIAVTALAALTGGLAYRAGREPGALVANLLVLAQTLLVAQVGLGLLLLSDHRRAPQPSSPAPRSCSCSRSVRPRSGAPGASAPSRSCSGSCSRRSPWGAPGAPSTLTGS